MDLTNTLEKQYLVKPQPFQANSQLLS